MNYRKNLLILITVSTISKLIIASSIELGNDEVYYWIYAQKLEWNYFDHPPIVGWLIRLTTVDLLLHNEIAVRMGAIIASAVCTWLIFKIGSLINNPRTGWLAALLYTASIYGSIIAGTFVLPDSPQMPFWLAAIFILIKIQNLPVNSAESISAWCLFGLTTGLCIMCKVHGVFLWFGAILYLLFIEPKWLKTKAFYLSAAISIIIVSPIIIWNIQNHFASYAYHSNRVALTASIQPEGFIRELAGEIFYNNPVNFFLVCSSLAGALKGKLIIEKKTFQLLLFCSLPLIITLLFISLFRDTLPHWSGPSYSCLLIFAAIQLASRPEDSPRRLPKAIKGTLSFVTILAIAGIVVINFYPGTLSPVKQGWHTGQGDVTLDMYGWKLAGKKFDSLHKSDVSNKIVPRDAPIIVNKWFPAAHIDFYIANKTKQQTIGIGETRDLHQYYWLNKYKRPLTSVNAAHYLVPSNLYEEGLLNEIYKHFKLEGSMIALPVYRGGVICKQLYVFRLRRILTPG